MNKKKFLSDTILGIVASSIPLLTLQFVVFPLLSNQVGENTFGLIVTLIGLLTIIASSFGSAINNVRLMLNSEYEREHVTGDFTLLLWILQALGFVASLVCVFVFGNSFSLFGILLFALIPVINTSTAYYQAAFRLEINYKRILINSIIESVGYISGFGLFLVTGYWQFIYILGFGFCLIYHACLCNPLIRESAHRTHLYKKTSRNLFVLVLASFLTGALAYIDRLILFPLLGGESVSVYYVSTLIGKMIPLAIGPIAGVMLTYFAKMTRISRRVILHILLLSAIAGAIGFVVCILLSSPLLSFLYPSIAGDAIQFIYITTLTGMVNMICIILNPIVLRFYNINWQIIINAINLAVYLGLSLLLLNTYGLMGFCIGVLIATIVKFVIMTVVCLKRESPA